LPHARCVKQQVGWAKDVLPTEQPLRFHESEYGVAIGAAVPCFRAIRARILARHRREVAWRLLFRPVAADDALISQASGRDTVAITAHQNNTLAHEAYFEDLESIHRDHDGRPHWGKYHTMHRVPDQLHARYPRWQRFMEIRAELDPAGTLLNRYLRLLFGFEREEDA
jgi:FAD/FMN-containing dehydrogenase